MTRHYEEGYKGPLPGNQLEFISPFLRKNNTAPVESAESRVICYCNEFVGVGLGMFLAPARMNVFKEGVGTAGGQTNAGFTFSKRASKGAQQYKLRLRPGTEIEVTYFHPESFARETKKFTKKTVSLSFDSTVSVTEMKLWLAGAAEEKTGLLLNVYALVSPSLKEHPLGSKGNAELNIPVTQAMKDKAAELGIKQIKP